MGGRERRRCWAGGREGGRDGQSDQRQNCGCSMCTIKKKKAEADVTSLVRPSYRHLRVMPRFSVNADGVGTPLRSSCVSSSMCVRLWGTCKTR